MNLVASTDPILRTVAREVTDIAAEVLPHLKDMREIMRSLKGIGLAAPQVGLGLRFFMTDIEGHRVVINPKIVTTSDRRTSMEEGCLSFPKRTTWVARPDAITLEWTDRHGKQKTSHLLGVEARVIQHETDHLNSICIFP